VEALQENPRIDTTAFQAKHEKSEATENESMLTKMRKGKQKKAHD